MFDLAAAAAGMPGGDRSGLHEGLGGRTAVEEEVNRYRSLLTGQCMSQAD